MRISYRWLSRHVDLGGIEPAQLAEDLTLSTAEVEGLKRFAPHLADVTVGYVQERSSHPDADKLSVCVVDVGGPERLQIVCGAPNVAAGQKVAVATVGTALPGDVKIRKAKIRGVESCGMICSARELELGDEHSGIWELPADAQVGLPVAQALGLDDWVFEIDNKSLTHRPDLWGHRGLAGEVAAIYRRALKPLDLTLPATGDRPGVPVRIESEACSRYLALEIEGVRAGKSPEWLKMLLLAVGQRPIDLLVDLSNFVMLDLGQPNHLFDRERIGQEGIVVRMARPGESMTTLDGVERRLTREDLLICAGDEPVALAGVMGGEGSKVEAGTDRLLLEVASFHATTVRRTALRHALRTDASARFEKSLAPTLPMQAAAHLVRTLRSIQPELRLPSRPTDAGDWSDPAHRIELRTERVNRLLGVELGDAEVEDVLRRLRFGVQEKGAGVLLVDVPSERATKDVRIEEDLVEEVGRIHRYATIPQRNLRGEIVPPPRDERRELVRALQDRLAGGARFHEALSYSFVHDALLSKLGLAGEPYVEVINPVTEGERRVRRSVVPSLLALLEKNRRQRGDVRLFEIGKGYLPEHRSERGEPREVHELGLVLASTPPAKGARFDAGAFARLQGVVEDVLRAAGYDRPSWKRAKGDALAAWAHPGKALVAQLHDAAGKEQPIALCAELEPGLHKPLGLDAELASDVAVARVSLDALLASRPRELAFRPIPRFPATAVDLAFALPEDARAGELADAIERAGKGLVASCELFDLYRGESVGAGKKSLAFHVTLQSNERTLGEEDVAKFLDRAARAATALGGELRRE